MKFSSAIQATDVPPIPEAKRWLEGVTFSADAPLLDVSQAAPSDPPPDAMRSHMAELVAHRADVHLYGGVLGLPALRDEVAAEWRRGYGGDIRAGQVAITAGCNQAFVAVMSTLAAADDEVLLPTPWYFNHKMWLDINGVRTVPLCCDDALVPMVDDARAKMTERTRAIVLVTPNNPTGVEYPAERVHAFRDLCREHDIALVLDETYRDFHAAPGAPHDLFRDPAWPDTVIDLYSFSKTYRLTGHRVGAVIASQDVLVQMEKVQDTSIICANQLGQRAALWGMQNLAQWRAAERDEILRRRGAVQTHLGALEGWVIRGLGAYFAFLTHPFQATSDVVARRLVEDAGVLALPATMFAPAGDPLRDTGLRIAFANINSDQIRVLSDRLRAFHL